MTRLIDRLRSPATVFYEYSVDQGALLNDAADEIERLRERLNDIVTQYPLIHGEPVPAWIRNAQTDNLR